MGFKLAIVFLVLALFVVPVSAATWFKPDNPLWHLEITWQNFREYLTFNNTEKLELKMEHAQDRLETAINMSINGENASIAFESYSQKLNETEQLAIEANLTEVYNKLLNRSERVVENLREVQGRVKSERAKQAIEQAIENHNRTMERLKQMFEGNFSKINQSIVINITIPKGFNETKNESLERKVFIHWREVNKS